MRTVSRIDERRDCERAFMLATAGFSHVIDEVLRLEEGEQRVQRWS